MRWKLIDGGSSLRGLDAVYADDFMVTGYDAEGLWLVRPDGAREQIVKGNKDHMRDGSQFFGATAVAADGEGTLYVAYDLGTYPKGVIGLATRSGNTWKTQTLIDQVAAIGSTSQRHISIAATASGAVTVAAGVLDQDNRILTILSPGRAPKKLELEIDGVALAVDAQGDVHLLCNPSRGGLHYGRASQDWKLEQIETTNGAPHLAIAIDRSGTPHIAYLQRGSKDRLYHGVRRDGWQLTKVDIELNSGFHPKLAFVDDRPVIGHWASKSSDNASSTAVVDTPVRFAKQDTAGKWSCETVGNAFQRSAFALGTDDRPWFAFGSRDKLRFATGDPIATTAAKKK